MKCISIFISILLFYSSSVLAGNTTGKVSVVWVHYYNDFLLFAIDSPQQNFAACAVTKRYVVSTATQQGRNIMSSILMAKASGAQITVMGTNNCSLHGDAESISAISIN